jgi:hypothetical protein
MDARWPRAQYLSIVSDTTTVAARNKCGKRVTEGRTWGSVESIQPSLQRRRLYYGKFAPFLGHASDIDEPVKG